MIPIVIGALETIQRGVENLRTLGIAISQKVELIQEVALLQTARILRKVLERG